MAKCKLFGILFRLRNVLGGFLVFIRLGHLTVVCYVFIRLRVRVRG